MVQGIHSVKWDEAAWSSWARVLWFLLLTCDGQYAIRAAKTPSSPQALDVQWVQGVKEGATAFHCIHMVMAIWLNRPNLPCPTSVGSMLVLSETLQKWSYDHKGFSCVVLPTFCTFRIHLIPPAFMYFLAQVLTTNWTRTILVCVDLESIFLHLKIFWQ